MEIVVNHSAFYRLFKQRIVIAYPYFAVFFLLFSFSVSVASVDALIESIKGCRREKKHFFCRVGGIGGHVGVPWAVITIGDVFQGVISVGRFRIVRGGFIFTRLRFGVISGAVYRRSAREKSSTKVGINKPIHRLKHIS